MRRHSSVSGRLSCVKGSASVRAKPRVGTARTLWSGVCGPAARRGPKWNARGTRTHPERRILKALTRHRRRAAKPTTAPRWSCACGPSRDWAGRRPVPPAIGSSNTCGRTVSAAQGEETGPGSFLRATDQRLERADPQETPAFQLCRHGRLHPGIALACRP